MTVEPTASESTLAPLLQVRDLVKEFELRRTSWRTHAATVQAVSGVSFDIGEIGRASCRERV